jgi:hypothetical protein
MTRLKFYEVPPGNYLNKIKARKLTGVATTATGVRSTSDGKLRTDSLGRFRSVKLS